MWPLIVVIILIAPTAYAINFQLAGGVWILQTPAVFLALYVPWVERSAVIAGSALVRAFGRRATGVLAEGDHWPGASAAPARDPLAYELEASRRGNARTARSV